MFHICSAIGRENKWRFRTLSPPNEPTEVLDAARDAAQDKPITPGPAVRLALCWLTLNKIAERFQVEPYWEARAMTAPHGHGGP